MTPFGNSICDPIRAVLSRDDESVLAIVVKISGPSYRPVGAMMAMHGENSRSGSLSSGCIEADIALHGLRVRESGIPEIIRYGRGSPYFDIQLPCGGGLDILLIPDPNQQALADVLSRHSSRKACTLVVDINNGRLSVAESGDTGLDGDRFLVRFEPDIAFHIFGKGPEAGTFASLARSASYSGVLFSPDRETLNAGESVDFPTQEIGHPCYPDYLSTDDRTAVVLFFHDHDWEPPILAEALATPAFYIGAQGSRLARISRDRRLEELGVAERQRTRVRGPIGLIPSARDPGTLAVSVMADVLAAAMHP